jgi:hypothetical protein
MDANTRSGRQPRLSQVVIDLPAHPLGLLTDHGSGIREACRLETFCLLE